MTKIELEEKVRELEAEKAALGSVIESQQQDIIAFGAIAEEVVQLRNQNSDLTQQVAELQAKVDETKSNSQFTELAAGWLETAIGKRAMAEPSIDTAPFLLGVMCSNFVMIQKTYKYILGRFEEMGKPASKADMNEITDLLVRTGFAAGK